jgi:hypothetical protein
VHAKKRQWDSFKQVLGHYIRLKLVWN